MVALQHHPGTSYGSGSSVIGVFLSAGVNQDGRSSALTAPNGPAQQRLMAEACREAGVRAGAVRYVECHGTGTALGDPIEVSALTGVRKGEAGGGRALVLGALKASVGHTEAAAGIAGALKLLGVLAHGRSPGGLHLQRVNAHLLGDSLTAAVGARASLGGEADGLWGSGGRGAGEGAGKGAREGAGEGVREGGAAHRRCRLVSRPISEGMLPSMMLGPKISL